MGKSLREEMPQVAAFVDAMRAAFGKGAIDAQIRRGMQGEPVFYAQENGREVGTMPASFVWPQDEKQDEVDHGQDQVGG